MAGSTFLVKWACPRAGCSEIYEHVVTPRRPRRSAIDYGNCYAKAGAVSLSLVARAQFSVGAAGLGHHKRTSCGIGFGNPDPGRPAPNGGRTALRCSTTRNKSTSGTGCCRPSSSKSSRGASRAISRRSLLTRLAERCLLWSDWTTHIDG